MTTCERVSGKTLRTAVVAVLALLIGALGGRSAEAFNPAGLIAPIHKGSTGFWNLEALTVPGQFAGATVTSIVDGVDVNDKLVAATNRGFTAEVKIVTLDIDQAGVVTGMADLIVSDGGVVVETIPVEVVGVLQLTEVWRRAYLRNDATLAGDGDLARRRVYQLRIIGRARGAGFSLVANMVDVVDFSNDPAQDLVVMDGRLAVNVNGVFQNGSRYGIGRSDVVISGLRDAETVWQIDASNFAPFVSNVAWRGKAALFTPWHPAGVDADVAMMTRWSNPRTGRPGVYRIAYTARDGRYRYGLTQAGRLVAAANTVGEQVRAGNFAVFGTRLRDTSFNSVSPRGRVVIASRRLEILIF
ncbi:MAG: hypothetical protein KF858_12415 [Candidatus Sumerlaeia bacterium]|nr:hypothetical protein [Candidatus Sumerlaeia bacterium]